MFIFNGVDGSGMRVRFEDCLTVTMFFNFKLMGSDIISMYLFIDKLI
jgi:hypothetical protein